MTDLCRRTLLTGAAAACGAGVLSACGGGGTGGSSSAERAAQPPPSAPPAAAGGLRVSLVDLAEVPVGGAVMVSAPGAGKVLVAQPKAGEAVAFSAVCPHEGCSVAPSDDHFACPCHGSAFELDGSLRQGPARTGLTTYPVRVVDGRVLPA